jgi:HK97 family phage major capsid protein
MQLRSTQPAKFFSAEYLAAFTSFVRSGGSQLSAALYEGSNPNGGYSVPVVVADGRIVPLAPQESAIRRLATVVPTTSDVLIPFETTVGTAAAKPESGGSTNNFGGASPALSRFLLSAFPAGAENDFSFELFEDAPLFQPFIVQDAVRSQQTLEESWFISGTGIGQAQGLIGNVGAGVTEEPDGSGNLVTIDGTSNLIDTLDAEYSQNATFLMSRHTGKILRKAQQQSTGGYPVWTRANGRDYLWGYPVEYSAAMPTAARGTSPVLFGDFEAGYIIGDRGGSELRVMVLDQAKAVQGVVTWLTFRRTDGRVRRPEAIQSYNIAAS